MNTIVKLMVKAILVNKLLLLNIILKIIFWGIVGVNQVLTLKEKRYFLTFSKLVDKIYTHTHTFFILDVLD